MAKQFTSVKIDFDRCRLDLIEFKSLLDRFRHGALKEREHVLKFFRNHRDLAALVGYVDRNVGHVDRIAYEFDFFGDYAADLAVGDSKKREYCFVEFENAAPDSIFKKAGKKTSLEWSDRFDHGYSQIIDWFWKLHDLARTDTEQDRFDNATSFNYYGLLVIGRNEGLADLERKRFNWRRQKVVVDSKTVHCMTFDELYEDLAFQLDRYAPAALVDLEKVAVRRQIPGRRLPRKFKRKSGRFVEASGSVGDEGRFDMAPEAPEHSGDLESEVEPSP